MSVTLRARQRGIGTLGVSLLLVSVLSLAVLYANRALVFEQRSSANQYRAARASELADAGLEWATAMLNDPRPVDDDCRAGGSASFRERYVPADADFAFQPVAAAQPACRLDDGALACACPTPADPHAAGEGPGFSVAFEAVPDAPDAVRVTARGCTAQGTACGPASMPGASDAAAQASIVLKFKPALRAMPTAALTAGGGVQLGGQARIENRDPGRGALLVNAGGPITAGGATTLAGPDGTPAANLLAPNDAALEALAGGGGLFAALFGASPERFAQWPTVRTVTGASASARAAALRSAYDQGHTAFVADGDLLFDTAAIGSPERPVLIATAHRVACSSACRLHGMLYGDVALRPAADLPHVTVHGALVTRGHHVQAGDGGVVYDAAALEIVRHRAGVLVRVPGSWSDF